MEILLTAIISSIVGFILGRLYTFFINQRDTDNEEYHWTPGDYDNEEDN